jgi:hypothetical protein
MNYRNIIQGDLRVRNEHEKSPHDEAGRSAEPR